MPIRRSLLPILFLGLPLSLQAQFYTVRTPDLELIYYDPSHTYVIPHLIRSFENALRHHRKFFHYQPSEPVAVLFEDFDDFGYAGASSIPFNYLRLGISPYRNDFETVPTNERLNWVVNHELTHIVASDKASSADRVYRALFGGKVAPTKDHPESMVYSYLASPRKYSPRWYHEGIAVFMETWMAGGIGRAMGGWDEMVFRSMVRDSSYIYDIVGLESEGTTIDFQVGANSYLYGTRFVSYCGLVHSPEKVLAWISRDDSSAADFASAFQSTFGTSLEEEWGRWIEWERAFQHTNLDSIRKYPVTHGRRLSPHVLGSLSNAFYDSSKQCIYAAVNYPGQLAHIAAIDIATGSIRKICEVEGPMLYSVCSLAYDPTEQTLFYTTNNSRDWRHLNAVSVRTGESRRLMERARVGDLAFSPADRMLWGVRHNGGLSTIVRIPPPYTDYSAVLTLDYGKDIFDLDVSPDGRTLVATMMDVAGKQSLIRLPVESLLQGKGTAETLLEFENNTSPQNFVFSKDGKYLVGSSYYTGVSNLFRYNLETKKYDVLTNAETGLFRPMPVSADSVIAFEYTGQGFVPIIVPAAGKEDICAVKYLGQQIVEAHPVVTTWSVGTPRAINVDSVVTFSGPYSPFNELRFQSVFPTVSCYKEYTAMGFKLNFSDALLLDNLEGVFEYSPSASLPMEERFHGLITLRMWPWTLRGIYNKSDFYDLFGPTKTSRKGYGASLEYAGDLISDRPREMDFRIGLSAIGGLDHVPEYQNVAASYDRLITLRGSLDYKNLRRSLGAVEFEQGVTASFGVTSNYVRSHLYPRFFTDLGYGFLLPIDHSSFWLRASGGQAIGTRGEPFASFYLGGFGNNWVDFQDEHRYREMESFPGIELNGIGGSNFAKIMAEWDLPPLRFRRVGFPSVFCTWARLALFSSALTTNFDDASLRRNVYEVGAQVNFRLVLFWRLESILSVGYAAAVEKGQRMSREFMVSLKLI